MVSQTFSLSVLETCDLNNLCNKKKGNCQMSISDVLQLSESAKILIYTMK